MKLLKIWAVIVACMTFIALVGATLAVPLILAQSLPYPWRGIVDTVSVCLWFSVFMAVVIWFDDREDA